MEDLEKLSLKNDGCLTKLGTAELILTLMQLGIDTEGKPDIISGKRKLIRWIQKAYEDLMEDVDKQPDEQKAALQDLLFLWRSLKVTIMVKGMIPILGSVKKIMPEPTNKSNRHHRM